MIISCTVRIRSVHDRQRFVELELFEQRRVGGEFIKKYRSILREVEDLSRKDVEIFKGVGMSGLMQRRCFSIYR